MLPVCTLQFGRGFSFDSAIVLFVCSISISVAFFCVKYIYSLNSANSQVSLVIIVIFIFDN